ncbi:putative filamentation protein [Golovinomyces cichoracearum]|uniref:Putative filamentation protein n=1 Tax=Golovinomyces cichoracearum TaxID=62708 RepID=A0A420IIW8_9PEZI|nr:putative filamentation protein [Golovinomyces cichoracearum]
MLSKFHQRDQAKAALYIHRLDEVRSLGDWNVVPELVRKIKKHAPQRACLILTAESEHALAAEIQNLNCSSINFTGASKFINTLADAIDKEKKYAEDRFQAQVCLGSIYWHTGQTSLAVSTLPNIIGEEFSLLENTERESSKWMKACALKSSYIKGSLLQKDGALVEAIAVFQSALAILSNIMSSPGQEKEVRLWTELYLTGSCMLSSNILKNNFSTEILNYSLTVFQFWAKFWESCFSSPIGGIAPLADIPRRRVWKEYHIILSNIFKNWWSFSTNDILIPYPDESLYLQHRTELLRVEEHYESLLISEIPFPRAGDASVEVEEFIDIVMQNWRTLLGIGLKYQALNEDGHKAASKGVLNILYGAAKKTFHSTAILRHLFTVHLAVAEFDLAFKAFDTYMNIIKKRKIRVTSNSESIEDLDNDDAIIKTFSECIMALCRYESYEWAEKANETCEFFENWLETRYPIESNEKGQEAFMKSDFIKSSVSPKTIALAWCCIGIGYANWARTTFDAVSRSDVQSKAMACFNRSLLPQYKSSDDPKTMFALGLILAETRQVDSAIKAVKTGLLSISSNDSSSKNTNICRHFIREQLAVPLWHLMALLLSARQDYISAVKSCEGAFDQYEYLQKKLCGSDSIENEKPVDRDEGFYQELDFYEKENLLQVKMTQLTLIELLDGPEVAVNASDEILSLYKNLFGDPRTDQASIYDNLEMEPPKSSAGKSFRESILNCSIRKANDNTNTDQSCLLTTPIIHISSDSSREKKRRSLSIHESSYNESHRRSSFNPKKKSNTIGKNDVSPKSRKRSQSSGNLLRRSDSQTQEQWFTNYKTKNNRVTSTTSINKPESFCSSKINSRQKNGKSSGPSLIQGKNNIEWSKMSQLFPPVTLFSKEEQKTHKTAILIRIWLLISGFYRRASMYDDAQGAIDEARQLADKVESEDLQDSNKLQLTSNFKWRGGKTVSQLWSDIYNELGYLTIAEGSPHSAIIHFESALTHYRDHPDAIVGLSNILMDIYTEEDITPPSLPTLVLHSPTMPSASSLNTSNAKSALDSPKYSNENPSNLFTASQGFVDLPTTKPVDSPFKNCPIESNSKNYDITSHESKHEDPSPALLHRLAARDRAFGLLNTLTKTGKGWNNSKAWFALARAYEESGLAEKSREVLWWCVELEENRSVRDWEVAGSLGYVL